MRNFRKDHANNDIVLTRRSAHLLALLYYGRSCLRTECTGGAVRFRAHNVVLLTARVLLRCVAGSGTLETWRAWNHTTSTFYSVSYYTTMVVAKHKAAGCAALYAVPRARAAQANFGIRGAAHGSWLLKLA